MTPEEYKCELIGPLEKTTLHSETVTFTIPMTLWTEAVRGKKRRHRSLPYRRRRAYRRMENYLVAAAMHAESLELAKEYRAKARFWYRVWYSLGGKYGEIK